MGRRRRSQLQPPPKYRYELPSGKTVFTLYMPIAMKRALVRRAKAHNRLASGEAREILGAALFGPDHDGDTMTPPAPSAAPTPTELGPS
jgi:hypothetical protein